MKKALLYIWQLPQNLLGILLLFIYEVLDRIDWDYEDDGVKFTYIIGFKGGLSLGRYVFLEQDWQHYLPQRNEKHEYGHCKQSRILGPLYLLVIGLPSLLHAAFYNGDSYYEFFTEKWADKLGGVQR